VTRERVETIALGKDGPRVGAIGFGAQLLSILGRPSEEQAVRVLHAAFEAGATLVDTADVYSLDASDVGHGERLIAAALRSWPGDRSAIVVATKGGSTHPEPRVWRPDGRPEHLRRACEASLRALGVERIDLYQLHSVDPKVRYEDAVGTLAELQAEGKIRWIGVSNVDRAHLDRARRIARVQTVQNPLGAFYRGSVRARPGRRSLVRHCARHGIGFIAYSPLGGPGPSQRLSDQPLLRRIAARHGASVHATVLAWVRSRGPNVVPIVSARSVEHARDSLAADRIRLSLRERWSIARTAFIAG
jgi:aryl-alcohol dehydrogenase-like predicted oxidoreductase